MRKTFAASLTAWILLLALVGRSSAHFLVLLPHDDVITADGNRTVNLRILFTHPMEQGPVMEMGKPQRFGALVAGKPLDLLATLSEKKLDGKTAYAAEVRLARPGDYVFYCEPAPYWEPAERKWIIHYTKVGFDVLGV